MANPYVHGIDRITGLDEVPVDVGVDYDAVTITIGIYSVALRREQTEQFGRAFISACWEAARCEAHVMTVYPAHRKAFAEHASLEAIQAEMDQAYAAERKAQLNIKWLTELLIKRSRQIREGEWPPKDAPDG
jgi:hypothetical protein